MHDNETASASAQFIDLRGVISPAPVAVAAPSDAECVVHNLETGATYRLNEVGARIWEMLEMGHTVSDIQAQLCTEYELPKGDLSQQIERDVATVLSELHRYGLVTVESTDPSTRP
jgi:hypothetical protein